MIPLLRLESKLISMRASTRLILISSLLIGIFVPLFMGHIYGQIELSKESGEGLGFLAGIQEMLGNDMAEISGRSLMLRNFYFIPFLMLLLTGETYASQRDSNILRELLCFPVSRLQVFLSKMIILYLVALISLVFIGLPSCFIASLSFSAGAWYDLLLGYLLCWMSDLALIGIGSCVAAFTRSGGTTAIVTIFFLLLDLLARGVLKITSFVETADHPLIPYFPGSALAAWEQWSSGFSIHSIIGLIMLLVVSQTIAALLFINQDV
ncbi:MAG: hypothetical protein CMK59_07655 [Proteobacteria bacterium]|nr:hypothetical protein [Pseudomonadota bacterium]